MSPAHLALGHHHGGKLLNVIELTDGKMKIEINIGRITVQSSKMAYIRLSMIS
jgi:hypothetical protein